MSGSGGITYQKMNEELDDLLRKMGSLLLENEWSCECLYCERARKAIYEKRRGMKTL